MAGPNLTPKVKFEINGLSVYSPVALWEWCKRHGHPTDSFWGIANSIWIPRGLEATRAFFLMTLQGMKAANLGNNAAVILRITQDGSPPLLYEHLLFLRATALFAGYAGGGNDPSQLDPSARSSPSARGEES